jgi:hypothetical protein
VIICEISVTTTSTAAAAAATNSYAHPEAKSRGIYLIKRVKLAFV